MLRIHAKASETKSITTSNGIPVGHKAAQAGTEGSDGKTLRLGSLYRLASSSSAVQGTSHRSAGFQVYKPLSTTRIGVVVR
jgi:hypothetical protein